MGKGMKEEFVEDYHTYIWSIQVRRSLNCTWSEPGVVGGESISPASPWSFLQLSCRHLLLSVFSAFTDNTFACCGVVLPGLFWDTVLTCSMCRVWNVKRHWSVLGVHCGGVMMVQCVWGGKSAPEIEVVTSNRWKREKRKSWIFFF